MEELPYKKKREKKPVKKSDHKHEYETVEIYGWFNYKEVCKICGKEGNQWRQ